MGQLSLRNSQLKFKALGKSLMVLEESIEHTLNEERKTERYQHVIGLTWKLVIHCQAQRNEGQSYIL